MEMKQAALLAKQASIDCAPLSGELKNKALLAIAQALLDHQDEIVKQNRLDLEQSEKEKLSMPLMKRLKFDYEKIKHAVEGLKSLAQLEDPVGKLQLQTELDDDLVLTKVTCPIGVIGVIFESRPDALVQIAALCLKSGNAVLLKGGREAIRTNKILSDIILKASIESGIPNNWLYNVATRDEVADMLQLDDSIDLIIPRGSNAFVRYIIENSRIPVLGHADGICHGYIHKDAALDMAVSVAVDSKTQYVAVCNAMETLLVHKEIAAEYLPMLQKALEPFKVMIHGCERTKAIIPCALATKEDWETEYLEYELAIKVVDHMKEAIDHINQYGSGHTETIVTGNRDTAEAFMQLVDSGNVFHNCSTRFSDGFKYGFGAEVGISTNKIHARGPVGLDGLVIYKYKLHGNGNIADDYAKGRRTFTHKRLI